MKKLLMPFIAAILVFGVMITPSITYAAVTDTKVEVVNEKFGAPIIVYGGNLTDDQKSSVKKAYK